MRSHLIVRESVLHALLAVLFFVGFYLLLSHAVSVSLNSVNPNQEVRVSKLNPATRLRGVPRVLEEIFRPKRVEYPRGT